MESAEIIDVIHEIYKIRSECCPDCSAKIGKLIDRWNAQPEKYHESVNSSYVALVREFVTNHEMRRERWESKLSTPEMKENWKKWVRDLYQEVCGEERKPDPEC